eukprot:12883451-Prorocentrum_lima.AAC.1
MANTLLSVLGHASVATMTDNITGTLGAAPSPSASSPSQRQGARACGGLVQLCQPAPQKNKAHNLQD